MEDNYPVLIPGMDIDMQANCKVYKSSTKPLLRARLNMELNNPETTEAGSDEMYIMGDLYGQLSDIIK